MIPFCSARPAIIDTRRRAFNRVCHVIFLYGFFFFLSL